jgi:hypothetical protein
MVSAAAKAEGSNSSVVAAQSVLRDSIFQILPPEPDSTPERDRGRAQGDPLHGEDSAIFFPECSTETSTKLARNRAAIWNIR